MSDLYRTLGVRKNASATTVTKAYRRLAMQSHPDRNPGDDVAAAKYAAVSLAYEVLIDPVRRANYDATGDTSSTKGNPELTAIMSVLSACFYGVIESLVRSRANLKREDVIDHMRSVIADNLVALRTMAKELALVRDALEAALPRISTTDDSEDVLTGAGRAHVASVSARLAMADGEMDKLTKARDFLKSYKYATDESPFAMPNWGFQKSAKFPFDSVTWGS